MGGAALPLYHAGLDYVAVEGRSEDYLIAAIKGAGDGTLETRFEEISERDIMDLFHGYGDKRGWYALQQYTYEKFNELFLGENRYMDFRILTVGPSSLNTNFGAICSTVIRNGKFRLGVDDWAGRGGMGSLMAQAHRTVAIAYGGTYNGKTFTENIKDIKVVNKIFQEEFQEKYTEYVIKAGKKFNHHEFILLSNLQTSLYPELHADLTDSLSQVIYISSCDIVCKLFYLFLHRSFKVNFIASLL